MQGMGGERLRIKNRAGKGLCDAAALGDKGISVGAVIRNVLEVIRPIRGGLGKVRLNGEWGRRIPPLH